MFEKYYQVLGLENNASDEDVKKAYKKMAIKYHPDKQNNATTEEKEEATEQFKKIAEAYEILTNKSKYANQNSFRGNFVNPHDIFNQFFRDFNPQSRGFSFNGPNVSINMPGGFNVQTNSVIRSSSVSIQNGKKVETIRETINGVTTEKVIVSDLNNNNQRIPININNIVFRN